MTDIAELRVEYANLGIGAKLLEEIRTAATQVARDYNPRLYATTGVWEDDLEDLVQDVVVMRLLGERQLDYVMTMAGGVEELRRLLRLQVRRTMRLRRRRTVIDRLIERTKVLVRQPPFVLIETGRQWAYGFGDALDQRAATGDEIRLAAISAAAVPRTPPEAGDRAPSVYSDRALASLLAVIARTLGKAVTVREVDEILGRLLSGWLPVDLGGVGQVLQSEPTPSPEDTTMMNELAESVLAGLDSPQRELLRLKLAGVADGEIAAMFGVSRQTIFNRKSRLLERLDVTLRDATAPERDAALAEIGIRLASVAP